MLRLPLAVLVAALVAVTGTACSSSTAAGPVAVTTPAAGPAVSPAVSPAPAPPPGTVRQGAGPFDDRFTLADLRLAGGVVTGALTVTSDVSELIVLEVHAAFYDRSGALLGRAVQVTRDDHADASAHVAGEAKAVRVAPGAAWAARVSSALVTVPVLVNE